MFEPIGGSAPKYTGLGIINPLAAICAVQLMLENLGEAAAAADVEQAIVKTVAKMPSMSAGQMGMSTSEVGDHVAQQRSQPTPTLAHTHEVAPWIGTSS